MATSPAPWVWLLWMASGVMGGGAHTHEEHILVSSLVPRATLIARLIAELE